MKAKFTQGDIMKMVKILSVFLVLIAVFLIFHHTPARAFDVNQGTAPEHQYYQLQKSIGPGEYQTTTAMPAPSSALSASNATNLALQITNTNSSGTLYIKLPRDSSARELGANQSITVSGFENSVPQDYLSQILVSKDKMNYQQLQAVTRSYNVGAAIYQK